MSRDTSPSVAFMLRGNDGRFQSALAEISAQDLVTRALGHYVNISVHIDWLTLTPLISSALEEMRECEISDSFMGLWSHWLDLFSYQEGPIRQQKLVEVSRWSIETLAKLQGAVHDRRAHLSPHSDASAEPALGLCSQYLATLMCCVHAKRGLEASSFGGDVVFSSYVRWIEELLMEAYSRCMDVWRGEIGHASHLYALALDEDEELRLYTLPLEGVVRIDRDLRFEFVRRNMNNDDWRDEIAINAVLRRKPENHRLLAKRLRDLVLWAKELSALINALSAPPSSSELRE